MDIVVPNGDLQFVKDLRAAGIIPPRTTRFELLVEVGEPARIKLECYLDEAQLEAIGNAALRDAEALRHLIREITWLRAGNS